MGFKLDDEKNWGEFVHEHAVDELADQVEANRVKNEEQDQRLDDHDQHLAKLDDDLATETRERKEADEAEKQAREQADEAEKTAREQADEAEKEAREAADEAEKTAREQADDAEKEAREQADEAEKEAREAADEAEKTAREQADQAEKEAREQADAEHLQRIVATEDKNTEQDGRLGQVESMNATQNQRLQSLEDKDSEQDGRLDGVESKNTEQDTNITSLSSHNADQDEKIQANANKDKQQDIQLSAYSSRLLGLENKKDKDTYPTSLTIEDNTLKLSQNDDTKNLSVELPTSTFDPAPLQEEIAVQEHLREIDNKVIKQTNTSGVHDTSWFTVTKHGGEFVTALQKETDGIPLASYDLEYWLQSKRSNINVRKDGKLAFVNTLTEGVYLEGSQHSDSVITGPLTALVPWAINKQVAYNVVSSTDTTKTVAVVAPMGTVLYQVGYEVTGASDSMLNIFLYGLKSLSYPLIGTSRFDVAPTLENYRSDFSKLTHGNLDTIGAVHLPLTFAPDLMTDNITEIDVPDQIKQKVPELQPGYELRMYELTKITL